MSWLVPGGIGVAWSALLTYHELRKDKISLQNQLEPTAEIDPVPYLQPVHTDNGRLYYIGIKNPSGKPLRGERVLLTSINPPDKDFQWLPIPLHIKHDNRKQHKETFDINPGGVRLIEFDF